MLKLTIEQAKRIRGVATRIELPEEELRPADIGATVQHGDRSYTLHDAMVREPLLAELAKAKMMLRDLGVEIISGA